MEIDADYLRSPTLNLDIRWGYDVYHKYSTTSSTWFGLDGSLCGIVMPNLQPLAPNRCAESVSVCIQLAQPRIADSKEVRDLVQQCAAHLHT
jgi:hypothetical protein